MTLGTSRDIFSTIPAELHLQIYSSACLDDGFTGRSLSRVSKHIREYSKVHRYNSIALSNNAQITAFRNILDNEDGQARRKAFIYPLWPQTVNIHGVESGFYDIVFYHSTNSTEHPRLFGHHEGLRIRFQLTGNFVSLWDARGLALSHLLAVQSFPRLMELTLWSPSYAPVPPRNTPLLQLLHISGDVEPVLGSSAPAPAEDYPNLRRFRISQYTGSPGQGQLVSALGRYIFAASMWTDHEDDRGCFLIEALARTQAEAEIFQQDLANVNPATTEACVVDCISILPSLLRGDPKTRLTSH